jgi:hypothetical protein
VFHKSEPDGLVLTILDHILARTDVTFDEFVAVENYLIDSDPKWKSEAGRKQVSGLLQFRWLQLLSRALQTEGFNSNTPGGFNQPLVEYWRLSHGELFDIFGPSGDWFVPTSYFWRVFEANKTATWVEELPWFVANLPVESECEADGACKLSADIVGRWLQYWTRFPNGPHLNEALAQAAMDARHVVDYPCVGTEGLKVVADIRASLYEVMDPAKQEILKSLTEIERNCSK